MRCYIHSSTESVGICKHCYRGLCPQCVVEIDHSLSCRGSCENEVRHLNLLTQRSKAVYQRVGILYLAMGILFLLAPRLIDAPDFAKFSIPMGIILLVGGIYQFRRPKK